VISPARAAAARKNFRFWPTGVDRVPERYSIGTSSGHLAGKTYLDGRLAVRVPPVSGQAR
jgi:hypothetical protein